jgi:Uma2 family endonuclease
MRRMNLALRPTMTLAEFLAWEDRQELRHEFDGFGPVAMTGGTLRHAAVQRRLSTALDTRLRGGRCDFYGSDVKFITAEGTVRYPDGMVVCGVVDLNANQVDNPIVVFEVLSPSATRTDRISKAREYQATASVLRYVMLEPDGIAAVVYARAGAVWTHEILTADSVLALPEIGVELPLAELYEGIAFESDGSVHTA